MNKLRGLLASTTILMLTTPATALAATTDVTIQGAQGLSGQTTEQVVIESVGSTYGKTGVPAGAFLPLVVLIVAAVLTAMALVAYAHRQSKRGDVA